MNNIELIMKVYQCFFDGDLVGWAKFHTDDFELKQPGNFPHSGTFIGPIVAIEESFSKLPLTLSNLAIEPISFFESGNVVFVHALMTAEGLSAETMHMFTINDGLVSKFQGFDDTAAIAKSVKTR
ncbi:MAG: SnoaL-like domain-containing protein [Betaproteobacteria bacterium]|jgi:ketosteroid isomerase-like protein|nr:SnoaL-like domain-containing protein [Betaproteobacteria bacterium]|tara:strand:- start:144 stop:518 length:375 start_codon:yes stop_codon:yes gene_type:complete